MLSQCLQDVFLLGWLWIHVRSAASRERQVSLQIKRMSGTVMMGEDEMEEPACTHLHDSPTTWYSSQPQESVQVGSIRERDSIACLDAYSR